MLKFRQTIAAAIGAIGATVAYVPVHAALLPSVLIIVDEGGGASGAPVAQLQASGLFSSVTAFDENSGNPLPTLSNYSSILAYTDSIPNNQVGLGNALLSYVQGGGGLVLGAYALSPTWGILGGIMGAGYSPFTINTTTTVTGTLTAVVPGSYLFNGINLANLTYWSNSNYGNPTLNSGGTLLATDGNGVAMIGMNAAGNVIADNIFPNSDFQTNPIIYQLLSQELACVANAGGCPVSGPLTPPSNVPEPASMMLIASGVAGLLAARRRRRG